MNKMFRTFAALALSGLTAFAAVAPMPALAQVPSVQYTQPAQLRTYRATILALAPASSATDFLTIGGKANIRIRFIKCNGISTAAATALVQVVKRSTADTTGTSTTLTNVRLNALQPVAGAVVKAYTVNPGALGTAIGSVAAGYLTTNTLATSAFSNTGITFDFTNQNMFLDAATTYLALNANAASFSAGTSLTCTVEWSE